MGRWRCGAAVIDAAGKAGSRRRVFQEVWFACPHVHVLFLAPELPAVACVIQVLDSLVLEQCAFFPLRQKY